MAEEIKNVEKKEENNKVKAGKVKIDAGEVVTKKDQKNEAVKAENAVEVPVAAPKKRKKGKKHVPMGRVTIQSTFNNTIITFSDVNGNVVAWATAGSSGFKGSRKNTPFAAQVAAETAAQKARDAGMHSVTVYVNGPGSGRESALRSIQKSGIRITGIRDVTPVPHNGCRPPKRRRV